VERCAVDLQRRAQVTNHSDFAEPAKQYLRECESNARKRCLRRQNGSSGAMTRQRAKRA